MLPIIVTSAEVACCDAFAAMAARLIGGVGVGVRLIVDDRLGVIDAEGDPEGVPAGVAEADVPNEREGLGVCVGVGVPDGVIVDVNESVGVREGVTEEVAPNERDAVGVCVGVGVFVGVTDGPATSENEMPVAV
jgi:hypothetical protein